ncbi:MAG: dephospho-CoA kinase [Archangium sp.]|nr:dephospho-CoA kinase [Archangium sp.]
MKLIGLTGGIATGKSTVSAMFREAGIPVIDADELAREVVEPGQPALADLAARFPGTLTPDGRLDRAKLGARIFADPSERAALAAITHPRIHALAMERTSALAAQGVPAAIYDAALLIENKLHEGMDGVILVTCPPEVQLARLRSRNALSEADAKLRIASQMPVEQKAPFATWVIDNGGTLEATRAQVEKVISAFVG